MNKLSKILFFLLMPSIIFAQPQVGTHHSCEYVFIDNDLEAFSGTMPNTSDTIKVARNEYEAIQLVFKANGADRNDVWVETADLVQSGVDTIDKSNITAYPVVSYEADADNCSDASKYGWYPDVEGVWIDSVGTVKDTCYQSFWLEVYAPDHACSGVYSATLKVHYGGTNTINFDLSVDILPFTLPTSFSFDMVYALQLDRIYTDVIGENITDEIRIKMYEELLKLRIPPMDIYGRIQRRTPTLNAIERGQISPTTPLSYDMLLVGHRVKSWTESEINAEMDTVIMETEKFLPIILSDSLGTNYSASSDTNSIFFYTMDEYPYDSLYKSYDSWRMFRNRFDGSNSSDSAYIKVFTTAGVRLWEEAQRDSFLATNYADMFTQSPDTYNLLDEVRNNYPEKEVWWYKASYPVRRDNWVTTVNELEGPRMFHGFLVQAFQEDWVYPDGALYWSLTSGADGNTALMDTTSGGEARTDYRVVYHDGTDDPAGRLGAGNLIWFNGVDTTGTPSLRLINMRDGLEDYEWMQKLQEARDWANTNDPTNDSISVADDYLDVVSKGIVYNTDDSYNFSVDFDSIYAFRDTVAILIDAMYEDINRSAKDQKILIKYPSSNDVLYGKTIENIEWKTEKTSIANVDISWSFEKSAWTTIVSSTTNDGRYRWILPDTSMSHTMYIKITDSSDGDVYAINSFPFIYEPFQDWKGVSYRINCGGSDFTDGSGNVWTRDQPWTEGSFGYKEGAGYDTVSTPITGTTDDKLYQTYRYSNPTSIKREPDDPDVANVYYNIPIAASGNCEVLFKFNEFKYAHADSRRFAIAVEDSTVLSNFSIYEAAGGKNTAFDTTITISVSDDYLNMTASNQLIKPSKNRFTNWESAKGLPAIDTATAEADRGTLSRIVSEDSPSERTILKYTGNQDADAHRIDIPGFEVGLDSTYNVGAYVYIETSGKEIFMETWDDVDQFTHLDTLSSTGDWYRMEGSVNINDSADSTDVALAFSIGSYETGVFYVDCLQFTTESLSWDVHPGEPVMSGIKVTAPKLENRYDKGYRRNIVVH